VLAGLRGLPGMSEPTFRAIPVLRIFDLAKAKEFYLDFLGFRLEWAHRFADGAPVYLQIARGDLVLHLSEHHGDGSPGAVVYVRTTGLADFHREITAKDYPFLRPGLERTPWRSMLMELTDPFHNRLRFDEKLPPSEGER
jgi:catechol 2,3-dioxygenase-like lactoylglutathione lyase family enzyme